MEFNETWQEARSQRPLPSLCFSGRSEKQEGRPGLWLAETFSTSPLKPLNGIQGNLIGSKISTSSTKFVFLGRSEKQDGRPGLWLAETFFTFPLKPLSGIRRNLSGSKISTSSTKFVFSGRSEKQDWLRHFRLLLWTEFNETWQEARSQCPLPSLCFSGQSVNKTVRLGRFSKRWHIVLKCTICGPLGLLFHKSTSPKVSVWIQCSRIQLPVTRGKWKLRSGNWKTECCLPVGKWILRHYPKHIIKFVIITMTDQPTLSVYIAIN